MNFYVKNLLGFVEGTSVMLTSGLAYENTSLQLSIVTSETDDQKSECELACNFKKGTGLENELNDWIRPIRCI